MFFLKCFLRYLDVGGPDRKSSDVIPQPAIQQALPPVSLSVGRHAALTQPSLQAVHRLPLLNSVSLTHPDNGSLKCVF